MRTNKMYMLMSLLTVSSTTAVFADQQLGAGSPTTVYIETDKALALSAMVGKKVLGRSHEILGSIVSINRVDNTVELKTETGAIVPIATGLLSVEGDHLRVASMSRGDVLALFRETGRTGVFEVSTAPKPAK